MAEWQVTGTRLYCRIASIHKKYVVGSRRTVALCKLAKWSLFPYSGHAHVSVFVRVCVRV